MSLKSFIELPEVREKIKILRPKESRKIGTSIKVNPRTNNFWVVGTAFDYLLRFELERLAPHAKSGKWVAESSWKNLIIEPDPNGFELIPVLGIEPDPKNPYHEGAWRAKRVVEEAKAAVEKYKRDKNPNEEIKKELAAHALRLGRLDYVGRFGLGLLLKALPEIKKDNAYNFWKKILDEHFEEVDYEDVEDLLEMLKIVPFEELIHPNLILLNPDFAEASKLVGGADTDLIVGDMLIDLKVTKDSSISVEYLDQLLGYLFLARKQRGIKPDFPAINRLGLYFCRFGYLWSKPSSIWINHPKFAEIEEWFFKHAKNVYPNFPS